MIIQPEPVYVRACHAAAVGHAGVSVVEAPNVAFGPRALGALLLQHIVDLRKQRVALRGVQRGHGKALEPFVQRGYGSPVCAPRGDTVGAAHACGVRAPHTQAIRAEERVPLAPTHLSEEGTQPIRRVRIADQRVVAHTEFVLRQRVLHVEAHPLHKQLREKPIAAVVQLPVVVPRCLIGKREQHAVAAAHNVHEALGVAAYPAAAHHTGAYAVFVNVVGDLLGDGHFKVVHLFHILFCCVCWQRAQ